jgi:hypothetical protein
VVLCGVVLWCGVLWCVGYLVLRVLDEAVGGSGHERREDREEAGAGLGSWRRER